MQQRGDAERCAPEDEELLQGFLDRRERGESLDLETWLEEHPARAERLRELWREWRAGRGALDRALDELDPGDGAGGTVCDEAAVLDAVERLRARPRIVGRYQDQGLIDSGGMGEVRLVCDLDLARPLAMKSIRRERDGELGTLARFLQEAQITAQLDHPGVVPVHELGVDEDGRVYFTMKLVRGRPLSKVFELAREEREGWTLVRALHVLLRVCEAMSYAHSKGVVHRDLKPTNVMVGRFGEVHVVDWGLARVTGERVEDPDFPTPEPACLPTRSAGLDSSRAALATAAGQVVGTPCYMAPEQAAGARGVGPASDVYAVGALLYHLLSGRPPYQDGGTSRPAREVLASLVAGPPTPLDRVAGGAPAELVSIAEAAMAREPRARYRSMHELAEDLRAFLENRVVRRHRTGPVIELRKWVARNRGVASLAAALLLVLLGASGVIAGQQSLAANRALEDQRAQQRLVDELSAESLVREARAGWPVHPDSLPRIDAWIARAEELGTRAAGYGLELADLRSRSLPYTEAERAADRGSHPLAAEARLRGYWLEQMRANLADAHAVLAGRRDPYEDPAVDDPLAEARASIEILGEEISYQQARLAELESALERRRTWRFAAEEDARRHDRLAPFVAQLDHLLEDDGLLEQARDRRERAATLRARSVEDHREAWDEALSSIADPELCPLYEGLEIQPQLGLVPLGRDPDSGLWEFLHLESGTAPERDGEGRLRPSARSGVVLVLIPGGEVSVQGPGDPEPRPVRLDPYFLAKFELTQAQWRRLGGGDPSTWLAGMDVRCSPRISSCHPVTDVSWNDATRLLGSVGLRLPTELQWEHAARAGTEGPFCWDPAIPWWERMNCLDRSLHLMNQPDAIQELHGYPDDRFGVHAPVHAFEPNPYGLYNVLGNAAEWCSDWYVRERDASLLSDGDGAVHCDEPRQRVVRGGSWKYGVGYAAFDSDTSRAVRSSPDMSGEEIGLRPSRSVEAVDA